MRKYLLFDTEAGGLDAKVHSPLSYFGIMLDPKLNVLDTIDLKIKPNPGDLYKLDAAAMKVNKINIVEHDAVAISENQAGIKLSNFILKHVDPTALGDIVPASHNIVPVGHNIGRLDIPIAERLVGFEFWNKYISRRTIDTGTIAQYLMLRGVLPFLDGSLGSLCKHYEISYANAHNAETDAHLTLNVLKRMINDG